MENSLICRTAFSTTGPESLAQSLSFGLPGPTGKPPDWFPADNVPYRARDPHGSPASLSIGCLFQTVRAMALPRKGGREGSQWFLLSVFRAPPVPPHSGAADQFAIHGAVFCGQLPVQAVRSQPPPVDSRNCAHFQILKWLLPRHDVLQPAPA